MRGHLADIIQLLTDNPGTRQAVLTIWRPEDLMAARKGGYNDIPCTIALIFIIRDNELHLTAHMRSCDVWLGLPYDVFCFTSIQILIAQCLRIEVGWYQQTAMSIHLYDRNTEKAKLAAYTKAFSTGGMTYHPVQHKDALAAQIERALLFEKHNREHRCCCDAVETIQNGLVGQAVVWASFKWWQQKANLRRVNSPLMKKHVERLYY